MHKIKFARIGKPRNMQAFPFSALLYSEGLSILRAASSYARSRKLDRLPNQAPGTHGDAD
jgi:hypothetical protein